ncbi:MAG: SMC-Scp complex subunit ScpB [Actinobacteria bacterium]|nr:SMC-Scp complex subunit ScpB [Actinomycetota bacterium]
MIDDRTRTGLEGILFLADEPLDLDTLADTLELDREEVAAAVTDLAARYEAAGGGVTIQQRAGGWRMYTTPAAHPLVERYLLAGKSGRLTQAALETLAVIAYKQPISRQEVSDIRGVNADGAVRSLVVRGFIAEAGRDPGPGQAILYGTTPSFLEKLGLDSLDDLPPLTDFLPEAPAPDEPAADRLREARRRLASGGELPSTGAARWDADPRTNTGEDAAEEEGEDALPPIAARAGRRDQDSEMDELTARLETAARSAMTQLREAVAATEPEDDDEDVAATGDGGDSDEEST